MKILYIVHTGGPGGSSVALYNLISRIYKKVEVAVVFPAKGTFSNSIEKLGVQCYYLPFVRLSDYPSSASMSEKLMFIYRVFKKITQDIICYFQLADITKDWKPDIIHTNVGPLSIGFRVAKKMGIKHVWHLREYQDLDFGIHFFPSVKWFKKMLKAPNNFTIAITRDIFRYWELNWNKDKVIYDGVIEDAEHNIITNKNQYFLFVGRIEEAKGTKDLINAFAKFYQINTKYKLLIAGTANGDGKYYEECIALVRENCLQKNVVFLGHRDDVYKLMEEATAIVVSSRFEGFGFITAEAMYNHCLVIGRNTAGTKEQFDIGRELTGHEIGLPYDMDELYDCLVKAAAFTTSEVLEIVNRSYETVRQNYTIDKHCNSVLKFYTEILNA